MDPVKCVVLWVRILLLWVVLQSHLKRFVTILWYYFFFRPTLIWHHLVTVDAMTTGLVTAPVSGLMGLAFESLASTQSTPFWQAVTNNNLLSSPEMSFWLARDLNPASESSLAPGGAFTFGGTNSTLFSGDIEFLDLTSAPSFWLLSLSSKYYSVWTCGLVLNLWQALPSMVKRWHSRLLMLRQLSTQGPLSSEDLTLMLYLCTTLFRDLLTWVTKTLGFMRTVCSTFRSSSFSSSLICCHFSL